NNRNLTTPARNQSNQAKQCRRAELLRVLSRQPSIRRKKTFEFFSMIRLPRAVGNSTLRVAGVALGFCSWIAISNHCAFAAIATTIDLTQSACPFHSKPAKEKQQSSQVQCCKILRAVALAKTKSWARDDAKLSTVDLCLRERALIARSLSTLPLLLDTGPPGARSFAELILQRSLLAHAPPFRA